MKIRKVAALFITLCLLLVGCNSGASSQTSSAAEPQPTVWNNPTELKLTNPSFFGGEESEYRTAWEENIASLGFSVSVVSPSIGQSGSYADYLFGAADITGLAYVPDYGTLTSLITSGKIVAIDEYLAGSELWSSLPKAFTDALTVGGSVWGIPADGGYTLPWLTYYKTSDYADLLGATAVLGATAAAAENFVSTVNNAVMAGAAGIYSSDASALGWIAEQYGLPLTADGGNILYSDSLGEVIDSMLLDGAADALLQARKLYNGGAINADFASLGLNGLTDAVLGGSVGIVTYPAGQYEGYTESDKLTASQQITTYGGCYCLFKDSAEPGESVNALLKLLWGSEESHRAMSIGYSGYTVGGSGEYLLEYVSSKQKTAFPTPSLCGSLPGLFDLSSDVRVFADADENRRAAAIETASYLDGLYAEGIADGKLTVTDYRLTAVLSQKYNENRAAVEAAYEKLLTSALTDMNVTVRQALEDYKATMAALGGDEILKQANEAYGVTATQSYTK